jgi:hypothetical protein
MNLVSSFWGGGTLPYISLEDMVMNLVEGLRILIASRQLTTLVPVASQVGILISKLTRTCDWAAVFTKIAGWILDTKLETDE